MWQKHRKKRRIIKTIFFVLLMVVILIAAYVVFFKLNLFKPKVSEEVMNNTYKTINGFDGINLYTLNISEMISLGEPGIYALDEIYKDENSTPEQKWACIMGISALGHNLNLTNKALPFLKEALNDEDVNVRVTAASLILSFGSTDGIPILITELENDAILKPSEPVMPINSYCAETLTSYTGQDFGVDKAAWQNWWDTNKETFSLG